MLRAPFHTWRCYSWLLTVAIAAVTPAVLGVPSLSQQPQSASGTAGTPVTLSVLATGTGGLAYQWRFNGRPIPNAVASFLSLARPSQVDSGFYDVLVSDSTGTVTSSPAYLRIAPTTYPDTLIPQLSSRVVLEHARSGTMSAIAMNADGSFFVCGDFSSVSGERHGGLTRFRADGTVDRTFAPPEFDGVVRSIATQPDGRLVVVGEFRNVNGAPSPGIVRLHGSGTVDSSFRVGDGFSLSGNSSYPQVEVASDGTIYVAHDSFSYQGQGVAGLVRLQPSGAIDSTFAFPRSATRPPAFTVAPDGRIYCVGVRFSVAVAGTASTVCRFLPNGTLDPTFDAGSGTGSLFAVPRGLFRQRDGRLVIIGSGYASFSGRDTPTGMVRLNENGTVDTSFNPALAARGAYSVDQAANGDLLVSISFPQTGSNSIIRLRPDGSLATFGAPLLRSAGLVRVTPAGRIVLASGGISGGTTELVRAEVVLLENTGTRVNTSADFKFPAEVRMLRLLPDGKLLVGGTFSHWNGAPVPSLVRLNADLSLDPTFRSAVNPAQFIDAGTLQPDGRIMVVGAFSTLSPSLLRRFNADGALDATFTPSTLILSVGRVSILQDGRIVVPDPLAGAPGLRLFTPAGTLVTTHEFAAGGNAVRSSNNVIATASDQNYVLGGFGTWSGQPRSKIVRLNRDGTVDPAFTSSISDISYAVSFDTVDNPAQSNGRILFRSSGPPKLVGLLPSGQVDPAFTFALAALNAFHGYTIQADDRILAWGTTTNASVPEPLVVRLLANGAIDPSFALVGESGTLPPALRAWRHAVTLDDGHMVAATASGTLLRFTRVATPLLTTPPVAATRTSGESVTFTVAAAGAGPFTYQWLLNGNPVAGATSATLRIPFALSSHAGEYSVVVTNANGATRSPGVPLTISQGASRLSNLSVRATVTNSSPIITGFTLNGGGKEVLIRGIGPGLAQFNVPGTAADPRLAIYAGASLIDQNDNWGGATALGAASSAVGAFPIAPSSLDAVVLRVVSGSATAQLSTAGGSGVTLTEIYDTAPLGGSAARLSNVSVRSQVGTDTDILIAGFSISGPASKALLIRGVGPGLAAFGVPGRLADPQLAVFSGATRIAENGDWGDGALLATAFAEVGAFGLEPGSRDAAVAAYLPPGSYTVQLSGAGGTTGEGLIEIYELP